MPTPALVYILLSNKSETTYVQAFETLKNLLEIKVKYVVTDFELGLFNSIENVFKCRINGCLFHLGQSIYRKVQKMGLSTAYRNNPALRNVIKSLLNFAYVPAEDVVDFFLI